MKDSDDPNNAQDKSEEPNIDDTKSNTDGRNSGIYERFLNRVQQINSEFDNNQNNTSSYEPLSEKELDFFYDTKKNYESDNVTNHYEQPLTEDKLTHKNDDGTLDIDYSQNFIDNEPNDDHLDSTDEDQYDAPPIIPNEIESTENNETNDKRSKDKKLGALRGRQVSSIKLLIVGVVCGLLLSAAIVVILNSTGVLASLTGNSAADNTETIVPNVAAVPVTQPTTESTSEPQPTASTEVDTLPTLSQEPIGQEQIAVIDTKSVSNDPINNNKSTVKLEKVTPATADTKKENVPVNNANNNSAISIEDFKEEAQNTLYRETKD